MDKQYDANEVMKELRRHEENCNKRHEEIRGNFAKVKGDIVEVKAEVKAEVKETNKNIARWGVGVVAALTLVIGIMTLLFSVISNNQSNAQPAYIPVPFPVQAQELQKLFPAPTATATQEQTDKEG
ncbi:MAG: hypothetical protein OXF09_06340 [Hyphomicrobiales bacterium]|nr:hypothetical protein [Hyphomicrobiales bacterium]